MNLDHENRNERSRVSTNRCYSLTTVSFATVVYSSNGHITVENEGP